MKILGYRHFWRTLLAFCLLLSPLSWSVPESNVAFANSNTTCQLTWQHVAAPQLGSDPVRFHDLVALAPNTVYASGQSGDYPMSQPLLLQSDSQTWKKENLPEGFPALAILGGSSPDNVWAMNGSGSGAYRWDGQMWSLQPEPLFARYAAIAARSKKLVWVVGDDGNTSSRRTSTALWDGKVWQAIHSPNTRLLYSTLEGIAVLERKNAWAVGWGSNRTGDNPQAKRKRALVIHWDGKEWKKIRVPGRGGASLNAIAANAPDDIWAVGEKLSGDVMSPYLIHWNGKRWKQFPAPIQPEPANLLTIKGVAALASDDVWVVGTDYNGGDIPIVLHWNGSQWQRITTPPTRGLQKIVALSQNEIWVSSYEQIAHWNGAGWEWSKLPSVGGGTANFNDVTGVSAEDAWIAAGATAYGVFNALTLHWNRERWDVVPIPNPANSYLTAIASISPGNVWAVGSSLAGEPRKGLVLHWNGALWEESLVPDFGGKSVLLNDVMALSPDDVWAVGEIQEGNQTHGIALHFDGNAWSVVPVAPSPPEGRFLQLSASASDDVWLSGYSYSDSSPSPFIFQWNGRVWSRVTNTPPSWSLPVEVVAEDDAWVVGEGGFWHWDGTRWTNFPKATQDVTAAFSDLEAIAPDDIYAVGSVASSALFARDGLIEHWDGSEWKQVLRGGSPLQKVTKISADELWAVGTYYVYRSGEAATILHATLPCIVL